MQPQLPVWVAGVTPNRVAPCKAPSCLRAGDSNLSSIDVARHGAISCSRGLGLCVVSFVIVVVAHSCAVTL